MRSFGKLSEPAKARLEHWEWQIRNMLRRDDQVWSYLGIRGDENRNGYISTKPNIRPVYPFKEHGLVLADIERLLHESA